MPRVHPRTTCKVCGGSVEDVGRLSARGKCPGCAHERQRENIAGIKLQTGPFYEHWVYRSALAYRRRLVVLNQPRS